MNNTAAPRPRFDVINLMVCEVCIHLLANGEYNDGTDAAELAGAGMARVWGADAIHLSPGNGEPEVSDSPCEGCGLGYHGGDRFPAVALIPVT